MMVLHQVLELANNQNKVDIPKHSAGMKFQKAKSEIKLGMEPLTIKDNEKVRSIATI